MRELLRHGALVYAHDPAAMTRTKEVLADLQISYADNPYEAARGSDAVLILTAWREFATLDLQKLHSAMRVPVIFDGRNLFDPQEMAAAGFVYHSAGTPVAPGEGSRGGASRHPDSNGLHRRTHRRGG